MRLWKEGFSARICTSYISNRLRLGALSLLILLLAACAMTTPASQTVSTSNTINTMTHMTTYAVALHRRTTTDATPVPTPQTNAAGQQMLRQIAATLDHAQTLQGTFTTNIQSAVLNGTVTSDLAKMQPNKSRSTIRQSTLSQEPSGSVTVTNGTQIWQYDPSSNVVYTGKASTTTSSDIASGLAGSGQDQSQLFFNIVRLVFEQGQGSLQPGTTPINGQSADDIHVVSPTTTSVSGTTGNIAFSYTGEVYVDQQTHLPLRVDLNLNGLGALTMDINHLQINPALPASTFTFTPPAGASVQPLSAENASGSNSGDLTLVQAQKQAGYHLLSIPGDQSDYQLSGVTVLGTTNNSIYELNYMKGSQTIIIAEGKALANLSASASAQQVQIQGQNATLISNDGLTTLGWTANKIGLRVIAPLSNGDMENLANSLN